MRFKIFLKNFVAFRKAFAKSVVIYAGAAVAVHEVIQWIIDSPSTNEFCQSRSFLGISLYDYLNAPWLYLIAVVLLSLITQIGFTRFSEKIRNGTNCEIEISMNDIFCNKGQVIIPCNNIFASEFAVIGNSSIQAQMIKRIHQGKNSPSPEQYIADKISEKLALPEYAQCEVPGKLQSVNGRDFKVYEYGTLIPLTVNVDKKERDILLLAMSEISSPGVPVVDRATLLSNIDKMWAYIAAHHTDNDTIVVPVMGTGATRTPMEKQIVARYILYSFAENSRRLGLRKLILSVYPGDYVNNSINLAELKEYASFLCRYPNSDFKIIE